MDSYSYSAESLLLLVAASTTKKPPAQPVNINSADSTQLQLVRGIGPSTAEKILRRLQKRQRPDGHSRSRPKTPRKNEEISDREQARSPSSKHRSTRQRENKTPHAHKIRTYKIRRDTKHAAPATIDRAGCSRNRRTQVVS
jgi:hypothetical protein